MLSVKGLQSYYGTAHVLTGVDLDVHPGEVVGLLGRNGMGKTTLVRSIAGIRPPQVRQGEIRWNDEDIVDLDSWHIARRGIGLVPQGRHIFGSLTVVENLTVVARASEREDAWNVERVFEFFPRLEERKTSRGRNLSGGEQQMLAIGRALMTNPTLLLMDEPSEGLAPILLRQIRERLEQLKGTELSILLVEQNLGLALRLCDRLYVLGEGGTIAWHGTPEELDRDDDTKRRHLGV
jgi:branched-chain amino acid transport system ATP-binding protein